ncbi:riboflavin transporter MCH5 [Paramyrothecium foliicola]|nr:riboflavin transporter MCH5 [Paramyrothecium foliicola]
MSWRIYRAFEYTENCGALIGHLGHFEIYPDGSSQLCMYGCALVLISLLAPWICKGHFQYVKKWNIPLDTIPGRDLHPALDPQRTRRPDSDLLLAAVPNTTETASRTTFTGAKSRTVHEVTGFMAAYAEKLTYEGGIAPDPAIAPKSESSESPEQEYGAAPDGGLRAWLVALGAAAAFFSTTGYNSSFGVFAAYYIFNQMPDRSTDDITWIGSVQALLTSGSGLVAGPLLDRCGGWIIYPAAVFYIFAIMMTSICKEYWQFMLAQGIASGLGAGFVATSAMVPVGQWFDKKRGAAMGIAISGSSIGAVVFPILVSNLLTTTDVGFGWSVRITGFLLVPFLAFSALTVKPRLPPRKTAFFLWGSFKNPMYNLLIAAFFFSMIGMFVPMFLLPTYAITQGMDETLAGYLLAILNGASFFGRVIPGIFGDKVGRLNVFAAAGASTGIIVLCWPLAKSDPAIIVLAVFFGFSSGAILSSGSVAIIECVDDPKNLGTYMGVAMSFASLSALMGPPVSGALIDKYGGFHQVSWFSGILTLVGAVLAAGAKIPSEAGLFGKK